MEELPHPAASLILSGSDSWNLSLPPLIEFSLKRSYRGSWWLFLSYDLEVFLLIWLMKEFMIYRSSVNILFTSGPINLRAPSQSLLLRTGNEPTETYLLKLILHWAYYVRPCAPLKSLLLLRPCVKQMIGSKNIESSEKTLQFPVFLASKWLK